MTTSDIAEIAGYLLGSWSIGWLLGVKYLVYKRFMEVSTR